MKTITTIQQITHEDLVNLFSGALYGSPYLSVYYEADVDYDADDCHEDIIAKILLNGGIVHLTDHRADGAVYGDLHCRVDDEELDVTYDVSLSDIIYGLERAANGTFNAGENDKCFPNWRERNIEQAKRSFNAFVWDEDAWDATNADYLMQIILFDEIVY